MGTFHVAKSGVDARDHTLGQTLIVWVSIVYFYVKKLAAGKKVSGAGAILMRQARVGKGMRATLIYFLRLSKEEEILTDSFSLAVIRFFI
jgi:hypothetical protein